MGYNSVFVKSFMQANCVLNFVAIV